MSLNGFEEKMAKIGRTFRDEITLKADDAIEDLTDIMQKGDKVIDKLQKKEQLDKEKRKIAISIKALEEKQTKEAVKKYGSKDSGGVLGEILGPLLKKNKKKTD